jgi:hypothetical protein
LKRVLIVVENLYQSKNRSHNFNYKQWNILRSPKNFQLEKFNMILEINKSAN